MNILETLVQLRDDLKVWVTNNLNHLNDKIDEKTIPVDTELNSSSTNPVQNKVITNIINNLSYNDLVNAPNITEDGNSDLNITNEAGNIIFKVDAEGTHTTDIKIDNMSLKEKIPVWDSRSDFSGDYNDLVNAPNITEDGNGDLNITDEAGNIIFKVDAEGTHTTTLNVQNVIIENENINDIIDVKIAALVNSAPETLDTIGELAEALEENRDAIEALEAIANQDHFSGDYNDLVNAPNITEDGNGDLNITDEAGNIIFKVDAEGTHSTALILNNENIGDKINNHINDTNTHITSDDKTKWNNKVDKVDGKGLSSNDFTNEEKAKLASLSEDIVKITVDTKLSNTSENPVQNKVITNVINNLSYNDLLNTPNITEDNSGDLFITDKKNNVICRVNENGIHTVGMTINGVDVSGLIDTKIEGAINDVATTAAFSNVKVGSTTLMADSKNDTLNFEAGDNITITANENIDKVTISATNTTYSAATTSASGLMSANDKTKLNYTNIAYGTCSTAAATAAKVITITGNTKWALTAGSLITVLFTETNTANNPTFNVNGTGAKNVFYTSSQITTSSKSYAGYKDRPMNFMYDGTQYRFIGWGVDSNSDTKVTQAAAITTAGEYPVILGYSTDTTAVTNTVNKTSTLTYNPNTKVLTTTTFKGSLNGTANAAKKLNTNAGSSTKPVYFSNGIPVETSYKTETWTFELENGSSVNKTVVVC